MFIIRMLKHIIHSLLPHIKYTMCFKLKIGPSICKHRRTILNLDEVVNPCQRERCFHMIQTRRCNREVRIELGSLQVVWVQPVCYYPLREESQGMNHTHAHHL